MLLLSLALVCVWMWYMLLLLQSVLHKKYFSAFCSSCYCARRVLISSQRRHQTLQTDAARDEMHLCAMHFLQPPPRRVLFPTCSLDLLRWNGIISLRRRKSKANDFWFCLWPVSWLGRRRNRFCVSPAANYCANVTHKVHLFLAFCIHEFYIRKQWTTIIYVWQVQQLFPVLDQLLSCNLGWPQSFISWHIWAIFY